MEVLQPRSQGTNGVVPRGAEDERTQLILIPNEHVQTSIGLAQSSLPHLTTIRPGAWQFLDTVHRRAFAMFTIAYTQRPPSLPIKVVVAGPQVQVWVIEHHTHRNGSQFVTGIAIFAQTKVEGVQHPAVFGLDLGGDGELIVFFRESTSAFLDNFADGDASHD